MSEAPRTAVDKALDLVEAVARASQPPRLTDLAEEVGLHRATAYRVLVDLVRRGWVLRAGDRYLPGTAVLQLSSSAARNSLGALARPVLAALSERTGMMVNLQVPEVDRSRVIDVVRPDRLAMISSLTGEALPVHRFAGPLALVAALSASDRVPYLRVAEEAGHPLTGADGLLADIERAERTGFAVEYGRNEQPVASLARAVITRPGAPVCALTLVGLGPEFDEARLPHLRERLREATDDLGRILSGPGDSGTSGAPEGSADSAVSGGSEESGNSGQTRSDPVSSSRPAATPTSQHAPPSTPTPTSTSNSTSTEGPA
ncbi:IclR family transcriptional regulator [Streptomyces sp. NPDC006290]|uniref:IclR family transcriptional regulator n=1 Tax=Streptomyces sp. NPDC006290 TaxID=3156745 RepID=UPI0033A55862